MSACETQSFDNVTSSVWDCLVQKVGSYGIVIDGYNGEASKDGFPLTWNYDPDNQTLQLQCVDGPWWAPCSMINGKIQELVGGCL